MGLNDLLRCHRRRKFITERRIGSVVLCGGKVEPHMSHHIVLWDAAALPTHGPEISLRLGVPLLSRTAVPADRMTGLRGGVPGGATGGETGGETLAWSQVKSAEDALNCANIPFALPGGW